MATILEIVQGFCDRYNLSPSPTAIVGVNSPAERQYLSIFEFIGNNLINRPYSWAELKRGYTFTTQTGVSTYPLPGDFYRMLLASQWDTTNHFPLVGPISDANFTQREFAIIAIQTRKVYQLVGPSNYLVSTSPYNKYSTGNFKINPAGANNTDELFLGYLSRNWVWPKPWVASTAYSLGDLVSGSGYVYICTGAGTSGTTRPYWSTGSDTEGSVTWTVYTERYEVNRSNTKLNDADICLFDKELIIEGMRWKWLALKNQADEGARAEWEAQVKSTYANYDAPKKLIQSGGFYQDVPFLNIPESF